MDSKRERDKVMATEDLDSLKNIQTWMDNVLHEADGLSDALFKAGFPALAPDYAGNPIKRLEAIYTALEEKIENNEPITATEQQEHDWEADNNR